MKHCGSIIVPALLILLAPVRVVTAQPTEAVLNAIQRHESGGSMHPKDGDGGEALGVFQIHRSYFIDAQRFDRSLKGYCWQDCRNDPVLSRRVVVAYLTHYGKPGYNNEQYARLHNGGGSIMAKQHSKRAKDRRAWDNTTKYWGLVKKYLRG